MALYFCDGPSQSDIREEFNKASAQGAYLLLLRESIHDELAIRDESYTSVVAGPEEALTMLKSAYDRARAYGDISVIRVFEPGKSFEEAYKINPVDTALGEAVRQFDAYKEQARPIPATCQEEPFWRRMLGRWL